MNPQDTEVRTLWADYWQGRRDEARNRLVEHYLGVARQNASYWQSRLRCRVEFDELVAIGRERLIRAVETWNPQRGASFKTHATNCIRRSYWQLADRENRRTRRLCRLTERTPHVAPSTVVDQACAAEAADWLVRAEERLPARTIAILRQRLYLGWTLREIGDHHHISKQRVKQLLERGFAEIRAMIH